MRGRAAFQRSRRGDYCTDRHRPALPSGGCPDRLTGCSDCLLLLTGVIMLDISVDSGYKSVDRCTQSLQCRKLYQTAGHLTMYQVFAAYIARYSELRAYSLLQCELSALRRNHGTFLAETESLPKVIDQYSAENETCRNSSNCCLRRQN